MDTTVCSWFIEERVPRILKRTHRHIHIYYYIYNKLYEYLRHVQCSCQISLLFNLVCLNFSRFENFFVSSLNYFEHQHLKGFILSYTLIFSWVSGLRLTFQWRQFHNTIYNTIQFISVIQGHRPKIQIQLYIC